MLSWDGQALALVLVSGVATTFILGWPVTLTSDPCFPPAITINDTPIGIPLNVWPTRETGIGKHLLHRRLGRLLSGQAMSLIEYALESETELPVPFAESNVSEAEQERESDLMVDSWERICLHAWPPREVGIATLDPEAMIQLGLGLGELATALGVSAHVAVGLFQGEQAPTSEQLDALAALVGADPEELLANGLDEDSLVLLSPDIKDDLLAIGAQYRLNEEQARALLRSEFALAARSDGTSASRLASALHRLLRGEAGR